MKTAILIDGSFLKAKFREQNSRYPTATDVLDICRKGILEHRCVAGDTLYRVFFYDCPPFKGYVTDPVSYDAQDYSNTPSAVAQERFLAEIATRENFCLRTGEIAYYGWKVHSSVVQDIAANQKAIDAEHLSHDFQQKQVDVMIALDLARLALRRQVDKVVLIAGDSDFIPALRFARDEGLQVYIAPMGHYIRQPMLESCDGLII